MGASSYETGDEKVVCRLPPPKEERGFKAFLWNPKAKTVLGRTGTSWAKIGAFYVVFYTFLAMYFALLMFIFYRTLEPDTPKYTGEDSLLVNPGIGFRPHTYYDDLRPTIKYNPTEEKTYSSYVTSINKFWEAYTSIPANAKDCLPSEGYRTADDPPCSFDLATTNTTCSPDDQWGYNSDSPCLLFKLNRMFHWKPQPPESFDGLPEGLRRHINASSEDPEMTLKQNVWVWCESEGVEIEQKSPGLPLSFFPYHKQDGYRSPIVPVRLLHVEAGKKVHVDCRVWASNVKPKAGTRMTGEVRIFVELEGGAT